MSSFFGILFLLVSLITNPANATENATPNTAAIVVNEVGVPVDGVVTEVRKLGHGFHVEVDHFAVAGLESQPEHEVIVTPEGRRIQGAPFGLACTFGDGLNPTSMSDCSAVAVIKIGGVSFFVTRTQIYLFTGAEPRKIEPCSLGFEYRRDGTIEFHPLILKAEAARCRQHRH